MSWSPLFESAVGSDGRRSRFLDQLAVSARPTTVDAYSLTLRFFAGRVTIADPSCVRVAAIGRDQRSFS